MKFINMIKNWASAVIAKFNAFNNQDCLRYSIYTDFDNGSGMQYQNKKEFLNEISLMIDDLIENGGTYFSISVDSDASCFLQDDTDWDDDLDDGIIEGARVR